MAVCDFINMFESMKYTIICKLGIEWSNTCSSVSLEAFVFPWELRWELLPHGASHQLPKSNLKLFESGFSVKSDTTASSLKCCLHDDNDAEESLN